VIHGAGRPRNPNPEKNLMFLIIGEIFSSVVNGMIMFVIAFINDNLRIKPNAKDSSAARDNDE
jgi:hypothetical protein